MMQRFRAFHQKRRGFTLVEALVAMSIMGVILTLAILEFGHVVRHFAKTSADLDAERAARMAMANVTKEMRQAMPDPNVPAPQPPPITYPTYNPSPGPGATQAPANSVTFTEAEQPVSADFTTLSYDTVTIAVGTPPPGHTYGNLLLTRAAPSGTTTSVIGSDIKLFSVQGFYKNTYNVRITVAPPIRQDMSPNQDGAANDFTLNTRVFISYYKTNS